MSQNPCFCDTAAIVNYVDTFYYHDDDFVQLRIDRETGYKYIRKTLIGRDTSRNYYQVNKNLLSHGETCTWYKNGQLKSRWLYKNDTLVGSNNFGWYNNGAMRFHSINNEDTIKTMFFNQTGGLSYEEVSFGGALIFEKRYCANGFVREWRDLREVPILVIEYYCSGITKSIVYKSYNKQIGKYIEYYDDGSLKEKGRYIDSENKSDSQRKKVLKAYKKGEHFEGFDIPLKN